MLKKSNESIQKLFKEIEEYDFISSKEDANVLIDLLTENCDTQQIVYVSRGCLDCLIKQLKLKVDKNLENTREI